MVLDSSHYQDAVPVTVNPDFQIAFKKANEAMIQETNKCPGGGVSPSGEQIKCGTFLELDNAFHKPPTDGKKDPKDVKDFPEKKLTPEQQEIIMLKKMIAALQEELAIARGERNDEKPFDKRKDKDDKTVKDKQTTVMYDSVMLNNAEYWRLLI